VALKCLVFVIRSLCGFCKHKCLIQKALKVNIFKYADVIFSLAYILHVNLIWPVLIAILGGRPRTCKRGGCVRPILINAKSAFMILLNIFV
jgi:hypothetical protein